MGDIVIPGFPTGMLVPGIYINVELGREPPSAAGQPRHVLLIGKTNDGIANQRTVYRITRLRSKDAAVDQYSSADTLFGKPEDNPDPVDIALYWMCEAAFAANPLVSLYALKDDGADADAVFGPDAEISKKRYHYVALHHYPTSDYLQKFREYLERQASPEIGFRQQGLIGYPQDMSTPPDPGQYSPRLQAIWYPQSSTVPSPYKPREHYFGFQLSSSVAAARSRQEGIDPAINLCQTRIPNAPVSEIKKTNAVLNSALNAGITPLVVSGTETQILRSVTTFAADDTYPVFDTTKVTVTDFVADDIELKMRNRFTGFKLAPDTDLPPPSRTATPNGIKSSLLEWLRENERAGLITTVDDLAERVKVEIDERSPGRVNFEIPEDVIEIFAVGAGNIIQIG